MVEKFEYWQHFFFSSNKMNNYFCGDCGSKLGKFIECERNPHIYVDSSCWHGLAVQNIMDHFFLLPEGYYIIGGEIHHFLPIKISKTC